MSILVDDPYRVTRDSSMTFLHGALHPPTVQWELRRKLKSWIGESSRLWLQSIHVSRYKPQRRCVFEYRIIVESTGQDDRCIDLIGKVRARRFGKSGYRMLKQFWDADFNDESKDGISVPEPIATIGKFRMWLQRKVTGELATDVWGRSPTLATHVARRVAEAAHKLHRSCAVVSSVHSMHDELRILFERLPLVGNHSPHLARRVDEVLRVAKILGERTAANPYSVIHRDFYSDQIIVGDDRMYLLDFDLACQGDPALDLGNMIGHVTEQSLRCHGDPNALRHVEAAMTERMVELAGPQIRSTIETYSILTLLRHVYLSTQFPERQDFTEAILTRCEADLSERVPRLDDMK